MGSKKEQRSRRNAEKNKDRKISEHEEELSNFLTELNALQEKYNLIIAGCGDCGSPWIENKKEIKLLEHLYYCYKHHQYGAMEDHISC